MSGEARGADELGQSAESQEAPLSSPGTDDQDSFVTVARVGAIADGQGAAFPVRGRMVAVFRRGDTYHAIDDICPHMGAALSEGYCQDDVVTCPWHAWRFRVTDGTWCDNPVIKIDSFPVRVQGDEIQVHVPE